MVQSNPLPLEKSRAVLTCLLVIYTHWELNWQDKLKQKAGSLNQGTTRLPKAFNTLYHHYNAKDVQIKTKISPN